MDFTLKIWNKDLVAVVVVLLWIYLKFSGKVQSYQHCSQFSGFYLFLVECIWIWLQMYILI